MTPTLAVLVLVAGWPLVHNFWLGFTDTTLGGGGSWIGFENYWVVEDGSAYGLLADPDWWRAVRNTVVFALVSVSLETVLGVAIAVVLNMSFPGRALIRALVLVPWAVPTVVSAKIWAWMLHDQYGLVNAALLTLGLIGQPLAWTADPALTMASVIAVDVWKTTPFVTLLVLAALQLVPGDCYEAAKVDGVPALAVFWFITLPLIMPALVVAVIFRLLDALRVFDVIYVLAANSRETMSMSIYTRQQLVDFGLAGYGAAAATATFFIIGGVIALYLVATRAGDAVSTP